MPKNSMETPMTVPAQTSPVCGVKAEQRVSRPAIDMVGGQSASNNSAFLASVTRARDNVFSPFFVLNPTPSTLNRTGFVALIVPMLFSFVQGRKPVFTNLGASSLFAIGFIKNTFTADFAHKINAAISFVIRGLSKTGGSLFFLPRITPFSANVPYRANSGSEMGWAKKLDTEVSHPITNRPTSYPVKSGNFIGIHFLTEIQIRKAVFVRSVHLAIVSLKLDVCTATNTWKRVAIATW